MQNGSVLVASIAVLKAPQKTMPAPTSTEASRIGARVPAVDSFERRR